MLTEFYVMPQTDPKGFNKPQNHVYNIQNE